MKKKQAIRGALHSIERQLVKLIKPNYRFSKVREMAKVILDEFELGSIVYNIDPSIAIDPDNTAIKRNDRYYNDYFLMRFIDLDTGHCEDILEHSTSLSGAFWKISKERGFKTYQEGNYNKIRGINARLYPITLSEGKSFYEVN